MVTVFKFLKLPKFFKIIRTITSVICLPTSCVNHVTKGYIFSYTYLDQTPWVSNNNVHVKLSRNYMVLNPSSTLPLSEKKNYDTNLSLCQPSDSYANFIMTQISSLTQRQVFFFSGRIRYILRILYCLWNMIFLQHFTIRPHIPITLKTSSLQ